ncbi:D-aminoacyl-tRNA deacylase [hydrothermal vent metagenome]|uniref:D-aminoacyl-tRNA deacylase n=1 Tax=hydrothermal vent metagenome TaxID=652676 RepID=A0A3B1B0E0_9ZZZZ
MIALIQRVREARVLVDEVCIAEIGHGLLALIGVEKQDEQEQAQRLLQRILGYRIFADMDDKMNLSLKDIGGGLLLVPQFTLAADTDKGMRPSFSSAAPPEKGRALFDHLSLQAKEKHAEVGFGKFGADMQVSLTNDGPVTFWLQATK